MSNILVIKTPYCMKKDNHKEAYEHFLNEMKQGLILLPPGFSVEMIPDDIKLEIREVGK